MGTLPVARLDLAAPLQTQRSKSLVESSGGGVWHVRLWCSAACQFTVGTVLCIRTGLGASLLQVVVCMQQLAQKQDTVEPDVYNTKRDTEKKQTNKRKKNYRLRCRLVVVRSAASRNHPQPIEFLRARSLALRQSADIS